MNEFPSDYVVHNLPLLLLSGLGPDSTKEQDVVDHSKSLLREGGFRIRTDRSPVDGIVAETLRDILLQSDASPANWNGRTLAAKKYCGGYNIRSVGRTYTLPPRKAPPPPHSPRLTPTTEGPPPPLVLHSTISPLTPSSPLYPDGVISPVWITKHQARLPAIFMIFFALTADPNQTSLQDNILRSEINQIRSVITSTNYKTKLVVVLLADATITPSALDERISNIRKFCSLDAKALYYLPAEASKVEIAEFACTLLSTLHPMCVEYYRDLSKHARRKRNRSNVPPPTIAPTTGTSQVLPIQGWNARYEFKLGVFAEFRQEMDAACRNYESAYESLFAPELFESIPSWSPRFNEARMLADVIAIRIIRCQLWTDQPTGAVRSWCNHRERMQSFVNMKGKCTENYGWEAWESRWSKTMAEMVARVDLNALSILDPQSQLIISNFAAPEKVLAIGERIAPWEYLHHAGYWLSNALKHIRRRRELALQLSEEERNPPNLAPLSPKKMKSSRHDTYLAPEPFAEFPLSGNEGYNFHKDLSNTLRIATESFAPRGQIRTNERLHLEEAIDLLEDKLWADAATILLGLWKETRWRNAGWWNFLSNVGWALFQCATQLNDQDIIIRLMWELSSRVFPARPDFRYDLHSALADFELIDPKAALVLSTEQVVSSVLPTFAFAKAEGNVGQPLQAQLCLSSQLHPGSKSIRLSEVKIVFEGSLRAVHLLHDENSSPNLDKSHIFSVDLQDSSSLATSSKKRSSANAIASLSGSTDLSIGADQTRIYSFNILPREAGDVKIASITMITEDPRFSLTIVTTDLADCAAYWWETKQNKAFQRSFGLERDATEVKILPKPPMVRIVAPELKKIYYTNEVLQLPFNITNDEEEAVVISVQGRLISPRAHAASLKWNDDEGVARPESESDVGILVLPSREIGSLEPGASASLTLLMENTLDPLDHELEIAAKYHIASDPETPLLKIGAFDLPFIRPFEANYSFGARYDEERWPKFFEAPARGDQSTNGIKQRYLVKASLYSFASGELEIKSTKLVVHRAVGGAIAHLSPGVRRQIQSSDTVNETANDPKIIVPDETQEYCFDLVVQKIKLGDRHAVGLDLSLEITWQRPGAPDLAISTLEIPRFVAPMAEPRILLVDAAPVPLPSGSGVVLHQLRFTLENPSMHFLTFNLTMESSEDFAFSGPKAMSVSLVPVSRHTVEYRLLFTKTNAWIGVNLGVVDAYFGKQLRVLPAGNGIRSDKKGNISVWIA